MDNPCQTKVSYQNWVLWTFGCTEYFFFWQGNIFQKQTHVSAFVIIMNKNGTNSPWNLSVVLYVWVQLYVYKACICVAAWIFAKYFCVWRSKINLFFVTQHSTLNTCIQYCWLIAVGEFILSLLHRVETIFLLLWAKLRRKIR